MCSCEMPTVFDAEARKARKPQRCCECRRTIEPGEIYEYAHGVWDHRGGSYHTCAQCYEVREQEKAELPSSEDCGPCFGGLLEYLQDVYSIYVWPEAA